VQSGRYDGSRRNYFFSRIEIVNLVRGGVGPRRSTIGTGYVLAILVADIDEGSERALGLFHAGWDLRDAEKLEAHEKERTIPRFGFVDGSITIWRTPQVLSS